MNCQYWILPNCKEWWFFEISKNFEKSSKFQRILKNLQNLEEFFYNHTSLPSFGRKKAAAPNLEQFAKFFFQISKNLQYLPYLEELSFLPNFEEFWKIFKISKNFWKSSKFRRILENLPNFEEFCYNHTSLPSFGRKKAAAPNLEDFFWSSTFQHQFYQKNCCCCFYNIFIHINMYIIKTFIWEGWGYKAGV